MILLPPRSLTGRQHSRPQQADARWTPSMQVLRRVLMTTLVDCGQNVRPFLDGPEVRACDIELVRTEFYRQYPADGTEQQKADARRKAFSRSVKESIARGVRGQPRGGWRPTHLACHAGGRQWLKLRGQTDARAGQDRTHP